MSVRSAVRCLAGLAWLAALPSQALAQSDGIRLVEGSLVWDVPADPGRDTLVVIEGLDASDRRIGEATFRLRGGAEPVAFTIALPESTDARLRAAVFPGPVPAWEIDEIAIPAGSDDVAVGALPLRETTPVFYRSAFRCGPVRLSVGAFEDRAVLETDGQRFVLARVRSGSGARYEGDGLAFWDRGRIALFARGEETFPECTVVPPAPRGRYVARGNEPGWRVVLEDGLAEVNARYGEITAEGAHGPVESAGEGFSIALPLGRLGMVPDTCRDTMTGMPYPDRAELELEDGVVTGCGGDPLSLLTGPMWQATSLSGEAIGVEAGVTLAFGAEGGLSGSTGCNRYRTEWSIGGEAVSVGPIAATRRACPGDAADREAAFFAVLAAVTRFDLTPDGTLLLYDTVSPEPVLRAIR